jgi:hypothetical protein
MERNRHLVTTALELFNLDGKLPPGYRLADDGEIFSPGNCGVRLKGWGETGHGGVVVSLLGNDDGEWFRNLARQKDAKAVVTEVQFPKPD